MAVDRNEQVSFYTLQDGEVTSEELSEMSDEDKESFIRRWFFYLYEDPANQTPYETREGGYQYIWGGPFDAREEIESAFSGIVSPEILDELIKNIGLDGDEWAPTAVNPKHHAFEDRSKEDLISFEGDYEGDGSGHYPWQLGLPFGEPVTDPFGERDPIADHDQIDARIGRGVGTSFGTTYERAVRRSTLAHAADLQVLLSEKSAPKAEHGGIGHNQPPSEITIDEEHGEQLKDAVETISEELNAEHRNDTPDVRKVSRAARVIQSIGKWVAQKLDMTLDAFLKALATALGTSAAAAGFFGYDAVIRKAMELYQSVIDWLNAVVLPF